MGNTSHLVILATVSQPMEATPIQLKLDSFGIESELHGELTVAANPFLSNAVGGIQILVSETDAKRAAEILAEHRRLGAEKEAERARTCPECGKTNGVPVDRPLFIGILAVFTFGIFSILYPWPKFQCPNCRHKWS